MSTWMIPVLAVHITLNMPLYIVCVCVGGGRLCLNLFENAN